jgi:hypothetical protein
MRSFAQMLLVVIVVGMMAVGVGEANAADAVNYDTAWTFVYDGGKQSDGTVVNDKFFDLKSLPWGGYACVGSTIDSTGWGNLLLIKLDVSGKLEWKRFYRAAAGHSIITTEDNGFVIGGVRGVAPWILRTDSLGEIKWTNWLYDSIQNKSTPLRRSATINCVRETSRGTYICAAGDEYPNNGGYALKDYEATLVFDSTGKLVNWGEGGGQTGYLISGFCIEEVKDGRFMMCGNQALVYLDTNILGLWEKKYTIWLDEVGTVTNNIMRCKMVRDGTVMVAGQAYEGNCWTNYHSLYYDAWWTPITYAYGAPLSWDTAGIQGMDDVIYDFTQMVDGRLVFVGAHGGGVWTFVTDSTGKQILWQKETAIPYKTDVGTALKPMSVCATPDSGFTVVGYSICNDSNGQYNAFAAHFVEKQPVSIRSAPGDRNVAMSVKCVAQNGRALFTFNLERPSNLEMSVYNAQGRLVRQFNSEKLRPGLRSVSLDTKALGTGVYLYRISYGANVTSGLVNVNK